jgi:cytochrome c
MTLRHTLIALATLAASQLLTPTAALANDGEAIVKKARCVACHAVGEKRVGPAYKDVAARYKGDKTAPGKLFEKVRHGGAGNWGEIPMLPHPADKISDEDLKTAIQWVLSLH